MAVGNPAITTHVLDTSRGLPAAGVPILLHVWENGWNPAGRAVTDDNGRAMQILAIPLRKGVWRITFDLATWFGAEGIEAFYPTAVIEFHIRDAGQHYHVPLLLSPFGYSTYRGS
ncbi:MAG TPA: hydroxyisourate hydrolase [Thermoanaerobaculia bacterium]|jgi:5-hydroxyisourate hydrolase|nr:hydroxyisourate hydrolase [Thermoanaerobaculia bacterium]